MAGQVFFKTAAFGGFQKEDVLQYIDHLNRQSDETQRQLEDQLAGIEKELSLCKASLMQAQQENKDLAAKLTELVENEKQASEKWNRLCKELSVFQQESDQKDREIQIQTDLSRQLSDKVVRLEEQLVQAQRECSQQAQALESGQQQAEQLLSEAQSQAAQLMDGAQQTVETVGANMSQLHRELDELRGFVKSALAAVEKQIDAIDQAAAKAEGFCTLEACEPHTPSAENAAPGESVAEQAAPKGISSEMEKGSTASQMPAISITLYNTPGVKRGTVHFTNQSARSGGSCLKGKAASTRAAAPVSPFRELLNTIDQLILSRSRP